MEGTDKTPSAPAPLIQPSLSWPGLGSGLHRFDNLFHPVLSHHHCIQWHAGFQYMGRKGGW